MLAAMCGLVLLPASGADVTLQTRTWANTDAAFADFAEAMAGCRGRNLLARKGAQFHDGNAVGDLAALADGEAGVRGGEGRVGIDGQPSVVTCYLGNPNDKNSLGSIATSAAAAGATCNSVNYVCQGRCFGCYSDFDLSEDICVDNSGRKFLR